MRVFAVHDATGQISELVTAPDAGPVAMLATKPGFTMTEIEVPQELASQEDPRELGKLMQRFRVSTATGKATLARVEQGE